MDNNCSTCIYGRHVKINDDFLCSKKGIVSKDSLCRKYKAKELPTIFCSDCADYIRSTPSIGTCAVFSTRCFEGHKRIACVRFREKRAL